MTVGPVNVQEHMRNMIEKHRHQYLIKSGVMEKITLTLELARLFHQELNIPAEVFLAYLKIKAS